MTNNDLVINANDTNVEIALIENKRLVEIHKQKSDTQIAVGDIFLGSIKKLMPGLNATFCDIGVRKDAFLHYTDLGPQIKSLLKLTKGAIYGHINSPLLNNFDLEPDNPKNGKVQNVFQRNFRILVQVLKEPISTKGPRLTCEITIPGRYMVMTPFNNGIAISKKIASADERKRLKNLAESIKPRNFGLILRTAAEGKKVAELHEEMRGLVAKWEAMFAELQNGPEPRKLMDEMDKTNGLLRDILNNSFNKIIVNEPTTFNNVKNYLNSISPEQTSFGKTYTMGSGAYLVIEHTEAMHVIDVNSGPKMKRLDQETAAIQVNLEAAREIARQLRLRDIGGLIIIDFIDMRNGDNKQKLYRAMREAMKPDRAQHTVLQLSKFGLMQITRQRTRPEVNIDTTEKCSQCNGTGKVNASVLVEDELDRDLQQIIQSRPKSSIKIHVHPYIHAYIKSAWFSSKQVQWYKKYYKWIKVYRNDDFGLNEYKFFDKNDDEIRLN